MELYGFRLNFKMQRRKKMSYFPFFVDISDRECLIVGGGKIAYRKACAVLKYGAKVLVVAPEIMLRSFTILRYLTSVNSPRTSWSQLNAGKMSIRLL